MVKYSHSFSFKLKFCLDIPLSSEYEICYSMMSYSFVIFVMKVIPAVVDFDVLKFVMYQNAFLSSFDRHTDY